MTVSAKDKENKTVRIYLTSWQKRMVHDFVDEEFLPKIDRGLVSLLELEYRPGGCLASYKLPPEGFRAGDWAIYLTDDQVAMVTNELGIPEHIDAVNVSSRDIRQGVIRFR